MSEAWIGLLAAVITGICSLIGVVLANNSNRKLIVYRIDELEKKVDKHNNLIERMTKAEGRITDAGSEEADGMINIHRE